MGKGQGVADELEGLWPGYSAFRFAHQDYEVAMTGHRAYRQAGFQCKIFRRGRWDETCKSARTSFLSHYRDLRRFLGDHRASATHAAVAPDSKGSNSNLHELR